MILQRLIEHAATLDVPPAMYGSVPVKWVLELNEKGDLVGTSMLEGGRKTNDRGKNLLAPTLVRSSGVKTKLLVDNGEYVLGIGRAESKEKRVTECHEQFVNLIEVCIDTTQCQEIKSVLNFLKSYDLQHLGLSGDFDPSMNITFRVNGHYPFEDHSVQEFWEKYTRSSPDASAILCHLCGTNPAEERMPAKVKRIPGGHSAGTALISANSNAFESYGLKASQVGPTCRDCAEKFTTALNHLLSDDKSHLTIGKQVFVFWSKGEDFLPTQLLSKPEGNFWDFLNSDEDIDLSIVEPDDPQQVKEVMRSAFTGRKSAADRETDGFYAAAFSAAGGRVVVRDYLETTIQEVKRNLAKFFYNSFLTTQRHPYGIYALAGATVREMSDLPSRTVVQILNHALKGSRLPEDLLYHAIKRSRAEQTVIAPRAALIKMIFMSNNRFKTKEDDMSGLNTKQTNSAYLCGRLLAVLEEVQSAALGSTNTTIVDRFYVTASTAPATVYPRLLAGARHHLAKLRRDKPGYNINLEKKLQEVMTGLDSFPNVLTLHNQGMFALGYYHQKQDRYTKHDKIEGEE